MVVDLLAGKQRFATLMDDIQPMILSQFIIWLDEKVAEFKVQGCMNLDIGLEAPKWIKDYSMSMLLAGISSQGREDVTSDNRDQSYNDFDKPSNSMTSTSAKSPYGRLFHPRKSPSTTHRHGRGSHSNKNIKDSVRNKSPDNMGYRRNSQSPDSDVEVIEVKKEWVDNSASDYALNEPCSSEVNYMADSNATRNVTSQVPSDTPYSSQLSPYPPSLLNVLPLPIGASGDNNSQESTLLVTRNTPLSMSAISQSSVMDSQGETMSVINTESDLPSSPGYTVIDSLENVTTSGKISRFQKSSEIVSSTPINREQSSRFDSDQESEAGEDTSFMDTDIKPVIDPSSDQMSNHASKYFAAASTSLASEETDLDDSENSRSRELQHGQLQMALVRATASDYRNSAGEDSEKQIIEHGINSSRRETSGVPNIHELLASTIRGRNLNRLGMSPSEQFGGLSSASDSNILIDHDATDMSVVQARSPLLSSLESTSADSPAVPLVNLGEYHGYLPDSNCVIRCMYCKKDFQDYTLCRKHLEDVHIERGAESYRCLVCSSTIQRRADFVRHCTSHGLRIICPICGTGFSRRDNYRNHLSKKCLRRVQPY